MVEKKFPEDIVSILRLPLSAAKVIALLKEFMNWDHNYYGKMSLLEYLEKYKPQIINLWYKYMESKNG